MKKLLQFISMFSLLFSATGTLFAQPPVNDDCSKAIEVFLPDTVDFTTIDATWAGPFHLAAPCPSSESDSIFSDIWYVHTATITGSLKWTLCGMADFDSRIAVYKGNATCPLTDEDLLACNEDGPGACTNSESELNFPVTAGETYLLRLGGFGAISPGAQGSGSFILSQLPEGPPNDFCENAATVTVGSGQVFTTIAALTDGPGHPNDPTCFGFGDIFVNNDIWYEYTADFTGSLEWSTCDAGQINFDSRLAVYGPNASCPVAVEDLLACNDDGSGCPDFHSKVIFDVEAGSTYLLRLGSFGGDQGQGTFDLNEIIPPEPPANDFCINADTSWILTSDEADNFDVVFEGTTANGSFDPDAFFNANTRCFNNATSGEFSEVWYEFNSLGNTEIQVRLNAVDPTTEFSFDLFQDCGVPIDTNVIIGPCIATTTDMPSVAGILTGFPAEPTRYIARITTRLTSQLPGDFFFQLVGVIVTDAKEVAFPGTIGLHPNPVNDYLNLNLNMREPAQTSIEIMNTLGQVVYSEGQTNLQSGANRFEFDVSGFANGLYFLVVRAGDGRKSLRFVKD